MKHFLSFKEYSFLNENNKPISRNDVIEKLTNAINNKFVCRIDYRGNEPYVEEGIRNIEPFALGINSRGNTVVRAWMIDGVSRTGRKDPSLVPGWRMYRIDRIHSIEPTGATFIKREKYNPDDKHIIDIFISARF